jgi:peptide-methionine (S)-S-oxide reductase
MATATFGAGCFWGVEAAFRQVPGVLSTAVGYAGGSLAKPTYEQVCSGRTGHAEVVQVEYDPDKVSYEQLLDVFWSNHDPTQLNRQGPDIGTQYRSVIFTHDAEQAQIARASKAELDTSGRFRRPIVTEIESYRDFYRAEEYHQQYLEKRGLAHCALP